MAAYCNAEGNSDGRTTGGGRQALREKNGKSCRKPVLSPEEIKEAREIYAWLKSLRDSETCRQLVSSGRHVNIQMRYLKAAWEAHKREVHQQ